MVLTLVLVAGFLAFEAVGYGIHRLLHTRWAGALNRAHMEHHLSIYPPRAFLSMRYLPASTAGVASDAWRFAVPALALAALLLWALPLLYGVALCLELAAVGFANSYVHDSVHVAGHWLGRFRVYHWWRSRHMVHHVQMDRNFGVVTFVADRVAGTYSRPGT